MKWTFFRNLAAAGLLFLPFLNGCRNAGPEPEEFEISTLQEPVIPEEFNSDQPQYLKEPDKGSTGSFIESRHFLMKWMIQGQLPMRGENPLEFEYYPNEAELNCSQSALDQADWRLETFKNEKQPGVCDFSKLYPTKQPAVYYMTATLESPRTYSDLKLYCGGTGYLKVWLNGAPVKTISHPADTLKIDSEPVEPVTLRKGNNRVLIKFVDAPDTKALKFFLRFTDHNGFPFMILP